MNECCLTKFLFISRVAWSPSWWQLPSASGRGNKSNCDPLGHPAGEWGVGELSLGAALLMPSSIILGTNTSHLEIDGFRSAQAFFGGEGRCLCCAARGILVPHQGWNQHPLQWKRGVLTTGPPRKSQRRDS